jgi:hypothetical protein
MTDLDIDGIKRRLEDITPGPWRVSENAVGQRLSVWGGKVGTALASDFFSPDFGDDVPPLAEQEANAEFVAYARNNLPALLSAYEQQAGEVERLRDFLIDAFQALGSMHAHMDLKSTHYRLDLEQGDQVWALFTRIAQEFAHRITGDTK